MCSHVNPYERDGSPEEAFDLPVSSADERKIDTFFDGELPRSDSYRLIQALSRDRALHRRVVADQMWIDELKCPIETPDFVPGVMMRLGIGRGDSGRGNGLRSGSRYRIGWAVRAAVAAVLLMAISIGWQWQQGGVIREIQPTVRNGAPSVSSLSIWSAINSTRNEYADDWNLRAKFDDAVELVGGLIQPLTQFAQDRLAGSDTVYRYDGMTEMYPAGYDLRLNDSLGGGFGFTTASISPRLMSRVNADRLRMPSRTAVDLRDVAPPLPDTVYPDFPVQAGLDDRSGDSDRR